MEEIDIQILKYINKHGELHIDEILKKFPDDEYSTEYRISELSRYEVHSQIPVAIPNTSYILNKSIKYKDECGTTRFKKTNIYYLTELGKTVIQDLKVEENRKKKEKIYNIVMELMRSVFFPLIVSVISSFITTYLTIKYFK